MHASIINKQTTTVRAIDQTDLRDIMRLVNTAWRVHVRIPPVELSAKIKTMPGFLAEDEVGLRGFMVTELQHSRTALIVAAGLRDTWSVDPYLDLLLPKIEQAARSKNLQAVAHIGSSTWLINELRERGFETRDWIVTFERSGTEPPPAAPSPAMLRTAHRNDLHTILDLDALAFDYLWRKSASNFSEALAKADSFSIAKVDDHIVGYAWCETYRQHAHLTRLAVHPDYQGQGIGAQLLTRAITDLLDTGANLITLNTQENNHRSHALYKRFGFVYTKQRMPVLCKNL